MKTRWLLIYLIFLISANQTRANDSSLVIINANIQTMDRRLPNARAVAILGNRIVAVGEKEEILKLTGNGTRVIDARGKLVLPGFNDSHVHFTSIGNKFSSIDLRFVRTPAEIVEKFRHYTRFLPKGRWILGGQWDNRNWTPDDLPSKELIDSVTTDNPVFIYSHDAKMAFANSLALKIAGIDKKHREIQGGEIVRNENGEPTGVLKDRAILFLRDRAPKYITQDWYQVAQTATNYAAALGVTSVQDMHSDYLADLLNKLDRDGILKTRVYDCTPLIDWKRLSSDGIKRASGTAMVRSGCLKSTADPSFGTSEELYADIIEADKAELQVMIHAIGNGSIANILDVFERVGTENGEKDRRFRVEHAYRFRTEDIIRFGRSNIIPSLQPHLFYGGEPYRSLLNANARIAFGSDASITDFDPLLGIYAAVKESNLSERLTVREAVELYTLGAAYAEFQDHVKGSITVGKLADLVILSEDILGTSIENIKNARVLTTVVDGKIVYEEK